MIMLTRFILGGELMKKGLVFLTSLSLVLIIMLVALPTSVFAFNGQWNTGSTVNIDYKANPAPSWLQIFSDGVKTTGAATICYPFSQGLEDWVGNIYQLKAGKWIKLATTTKWMPNVEGTYSACAKAPEAGTYVLMGYFNGKTAPTPVVVADNSGEWNTGTEATLDLKKNPIPSWLQLFSTGVKVDKPTKICHTFLAGNYGWVGEIRQLKDGQWIKLPTTSTWVPSKEGPFTSCATTTEAGTYALFGYWTK